MANSKRPLLLRYILTSSLFLAILLIPMGYFAFRSVSSVSENANNYVSTTLRQKQEIIDLHMEKVNSLINDLSLNSRVIDFAYAVPDDDAYYDKMRLALSELARAKVTNSIIYEVALFHHKSGKLLISSGIYDQRNMQQLIMPFEGVSYQEWQDEISQQPYFAPARRLSTSPSVSIICAYRPYPNYVKNDQASATLIIMLDANKIGDILIDNSSGGEYSTYIIDADGGLLLGTGSAGYFTGVFSPGQNADITDQDGVLISRTRESGKRLVHFGIRSSLNNWIYAFSAEEGRLYAPTRSVLSSILLFFVITIALGILFCVAQIRSHYSPIRNTVRKLEQAGAGKMEGNEIQYISSAIDRQVQTIDNLKSRVDTYLPILRSSVRYQLLYGEIDDSNDLARTLDEAAVTFRHSHFCVLLADIEMMDENPDISSSMLKLSFKEQADSLFRQYGSCHALSVGAQRMALVLNIDPLETARYRALMEQLTEQIRDRLMADYMASIIVGVSSLLPGIPNIHKAYLEAQEALEYYSYNPSNWIHFWKAINDSEELIGLESISDKQLIAAIKSGNAELAEQELDEYLQHFAQPKNLPFRKARYLFYVLMGNAQRILFLIDGELDGSLQETEAVQRLLACGNMSDLVAAIRAVVPELCQLFKSRYRPEEGQNVDKIIQYILDHHSDIDLSLTSVAEYFSLTSTYIAHILRKDGNTTFLELTRKERVKHAQLLLAETSLSLNDIARSVGYADSVALGRNFKKELRMTPGQYRESHAR